MNWDETYNTEEFIYGKNPNSFLVSVSNYITKGSCVLSLGEGEGRNAVFMAKLAASVIALDQSEIGLKKAELLAKENQVTIKTVLADLNNFEIETNSYDTIVLIFCHLPSKLRKKLHEKIFLALKPNGVLIMELYSKAQLNNNTGGPKLEDLLISLEEIKVDLKKMDLKIAREVERNVNEGTFHTGKSSVIQVLGLKNS
jgi:SAM-dependent methyltransferase